MTLKLLGVILVIVSCGGVGFAMAAADLRETKSIQRMIEAIEYLSWELQYRNAPLPELCRSTAAATSGLVKTIFWALAKELDAKRSPDVAGCVESLLSSMSLPGGLAGALKLLGRSLGKFDREGQLKGLASAAAELELERKACAEGQQGRVRCYQTLGLCAGAAIAILMI